jgi:hypothetical protein
MARLKQSVLVYVLLLLMNKMLVHIKSKDDILRAFVLQIFGFYLIFEL